MSRIVSDSAREQADLALSVYVEELAARRRVLFVGDASSAAPERLAASARSVDVVAPRSRARGARRPARVSVRAWPGAEEARSWELVVVPDLGAVGLLDPERLAEAATWLAPRGVLIAGCDDRGPGGPRYEDVYGLLAGSFEHVRMLGQAPFGGWAVVDFTPSSRPPEVTFDGSLLGGRGESPARWIGVCGARDVVLDPFVVVQVPAAIGAAEARTREPVQDVQLGVRVQQLEAALRDREAEVGSARSEGEELGRELDAVRARVEQSERRLEQAQREIARQSQKLDEARHALDAAETELGARVVQVEDLEARIVELGQAPDVDADYVALEASLRERAREVGELRAELGRRATLVRDLVEELTDARAGVLSVAVPAAIAAEPDDALRAALAAAQRRAAEAEAARAEARYEADELRVQQAAAVERSRGEVELLRREQAASEGSMRGLLARVAELDELRRQTEARLALAEDDRVSARELARTKEREIQELREQIDLATVRAHGLPQDARREAAEARVRELESELASRQGAHFGALLRAREAAADVALERDALRATVAKLEVELAAARAAEAKALESAARVEPRVDSRVTELSTEALEAAERADRLARESSALRARLDESQREVATLRGERDGLRYRIADAEAAFAARPSAVSEDRSAERVALEARAAELGRAAAESSQRADELATALSAAAERGTELESLLALATRRAEEAELTLAGASRRIDESDAALAAAARRADELSSEHAGATRRLAEAEGVLGAHAARVAELEAALAEQHARAEAESSQLHERLRGLEAQLGEVQGASAGRIEDAQRLAADTAERLVAREAQLAQLESELTHAITLRASLESELVALRARVRDLEESMSALRAVADVREEQEERELVAMEARVAEAVSLAAAADAERRAANEALAEARSILAQIAGGLEIPGGGQVVFVPTGDARLREHAASLERELDDRDVMLRSLTAQLQERDDRIRALARASGGGGGDADHTSVRASLMEAEERIARLAKELEQERMARRAAEGGERDGELRRLSSQLGERDAQLMLAEGRISQAERETRSMRDAFGHARGAIEGLVGELGVDPRTEAGARVADLLRLLRRY